MVESQGAWPAVTVVGLGGLGSWTALALAKCGFQPLKLIDHEGVESKNTQNQLYGKSHVGRDKVAMVAEIIKKLTPNAKTYAIPLKVGADAPYMGSNTTFNTQIVVAAVDSLESRWAILAACQASPAVKVLLDLRAGGGTLKLLTCNPRDAESVTWYETTLVAAPEAMPVCLEAFEAHVGMITAGLAVRTLQELLLKGGVEKLIALHVPNLHLLQDGPHPWNT